MSTNDSYRTSHQAPGHGRHYDQVLFSPGAYDAAVWEIEQNVLSTLFDRYFPTTPEKALDFACGTGRITSFLLPRCKQVVGIDISEEMLSEARRKLPQVIFIHGDLTRDRALLRAFEPFDCVTAFRFFLNAEPALRHEVLAVMHEVLKPGGILICNNHGNSLSLWPLVRWVRRLLKLPVTPNTLRVSEFERNLATHGFQLLEICGVCFLPRGLFRILPKTLWRTMERLLAAIRILNRFAIYQIYVAKRMQ